MDFLEELESFSGVIRMGRQSEVHRDHRRLVTAQLGYGGLAIARDNGVILLERPLHLLLQRRIVFDDQQWFARIAGHSAPTLAADAAALPPEGAQFAPRDSDASSRRRAPLGGDRRQMRVGT